MSQQTDAERELAELLVEALNLEDVSAGQIDPEAPLFNDGLGLDSIDALELALARLPAVIAYRMHPVTIGLYRRFIRVKYANLVNIMLDRMLVPELLQENCTPEKLDAAVTKLLDDPEARREQREGVAEVARWLGLGGPPPSERAADVVLAVVKGRKGPV